MYYNVFMFNVLTLIIVFWLGKVLFFFNKIHVKLMRGKEIAYLHFTGEQFRKKACIHR